MVAVNKEGEIIEPLDGLQKFAELIIADCLKMCLTSVGNKDYNTGRMHCHDNIKEHFGVE
jgi:hypothetical protein